jgi:hypothetical protein
LQTRQYPLWNALPLYLGDRSKNVHLQLAGRSGRVDAFSETDERHAEHLQIIEQRD